ncbi:looped-hinge helix DNA binding domain-containing protein, AbrB family [Desulfofundulus australicus DSM 11792]|nr:looped-hinge helix DNA binding domain-containing protein, AbrB family [Desulfofundulus australicus DSM 11792]
MVSATAIRVAHLLSYCLLYEFMLDYSKKTTKGEMHVEFVSPTPKGQVTIPKPIRDALGLTPKTKLRVYADRGRVVLEPVSPLDSLLEELEAEARQKGYTREDLEREVEAVREQLIKKLYPAGD